MKPLISIVVLIIIWAASSYMAGPEALLPSPSNVAFTTIEILSDPESYAHIWKTIHRTIWAFSIGLALSILVGVIAGSTRIVFELLNPVVIVGLTIPSICWTAVSVMLFGISDWTAIFAGVVIVSPVIISSIMSSVRSLEKEYSQMAQVFEVSTVRLYREIVIPQILPSLLSGARYGLALCWKVIIIAELLGLSEGVGYQISYWYNLFDLTRVFSWTFVFVTLMLLIEYSLYRPAEAKLTKWRDS